MHATRSENLGGLNADAVLRAMWQKSRALIEKCGSLVISGFSTAFRRCAVRLLGVKTG